MGLASQIKKSSYRQHQPSRYNFGFRAIPLLALISLSILITFLKERINYEISNPSMPSYLINILNENGYFFVYILPLLAFFVFTYDFSQQGKVNILGLMAGMFLILSFSIGLTSFLTYIVGIVLIAFSSI